jgi:hypothetical protein
VLLALLLPVIDSPLQPLAVLVPGRGSQDFPPRYCGRTGRGSALCRRLLASITALEPSPRKAKPFDCPIVAATEGAVLLLIIEETAGIRALWLVTSRRDDRHGHGEQHDGQEDPDKPEEHHDHEDFGGAAFQGHAALLGYRVPKSA